MRELGKASGPGGKSKEQRVKNATKRYIKKALALIKKLEGTIPCLPINDAADLATIITLEHFMPLMGKHIDLVERRILKGEKIPHEEKYMNLATTR